MNPTRLLLAAALASCASCALPELQTSPPTRTAGPAATTSTAVQVLPAQKDAPLYARDGSVVSPRPAGAISEVDGPVRDVTEGGGSRMYLLELYQQVVEERDAYQREVEALNAMNLKLQDELAETRQAEARALAQTAELQEHVALQDQQLLELAGRLTTAQIGRLQAEKALLEAKLQWEAIAGRIEEEAQARLEDGQ